MVSTHLKKAVPRVYPFNYMDKTQYVLRAVIFDCDGVLIDSEPLHLAAFKKTLGADGDALDVEVYKERYLALDDRGAFQKFYADRERLLSEEELKKFLTTKTEIYQDMIRTEGVLTYPSVPEFVMSVSQRYPVAVASGSRRHELELVLEAVGIRTYFEALVSADDVSKGKPDPESYLKALEALNASGRRTSAIRPEECLVIEDSKEGIRSAHGARMKCIAVATSFPAFELSNADLVVPSLASLRHSQMEDVFITPSLKPAPLPQTN